MSKTEAPLPIFYQRPEALRADAHGALRLDPEVNFAFARRAVTVPVSALEAPLVARHYPIVFPSGGDGFPLAVLSLRDGENLFVDDEGRWEDGLHIPAYIRRYPFIFAEQPEGQGFSLCVDTAAERIGTETGAPLFADGKPTATTESALAFCSAFEREMADARRAVSGFRDLDLLVPHEATVTLASGSRFSLRDFLVLDAAKVDALSDEGLLALRRMGALPLLFAHFASMLSWGDLLRRLERAAAH